MSWTKLTPALKRKITADWNALFPALGAQKPMLLLRRCGPLVSGIWLEPGRANDSYVPIAHAHCLCRPFPVVSLSLYQRVPNEYIQVDWHDSKHAAMAQKLAELSALPLSGPVGPEQIEQGYRRYLAGSRNPYEPNIHQDFALSLGWYGRSEGVERVLQEAAARMRSWPEPVLKQMGGLENWLDTTRTTALATDRLRATAQSEIAVHKLGSLPAAPEN